MTELTPAGPTRLGYVFASAAEVDAANLPDGYEIQNEFGELPLHRAAGEWMGFDDEDNEYDRDFGPTLESHYFTGSFTITKEAS